MKAPGFLPGFFSGVGAKSTVMQISFVMLIFLLLSDQILGGESPKERGQTASGGRSPATHCERKPGLSVI